MRGTTSGEGRRCPVSSIDVPVVQSRTPLGSFHTHTLRPGLDGADGPPRLSLRTRRHSRRSASPNPYTSH